MGKRGPLPALRTVTSPRAPLGTVRESFPSYGSSTPKASSRRPLPSIFRDRNSAIWICDGTCCDHKRITMWNRARDEQSVTPIHQFLAFLPSDKVHLAVEHQSDVCSLSCRVISQPVSTPLRDSFRFFRPPPPAHLWAYLTGCFPSEEGDIRGCHVTHSQVPVGLGACYRPGGMWSTMPHVRDDIPTSSAFWLKLNSLFSFFYITIFIADSLWFTIPTT